MRKILIVSLNGLGREGITSVIYNYCSNIKNVEMYFLIQKNAEKSLIEEFSGIGKISTIPSRKHMFKNYCYELNNYLRNEHFDVIHIHGNSGTMLVEVLLAKIHNVKKIIVHCHNTSCGHPIINQLLRFPMIKLSSVRLACSSLAGDWLYGKSKFLVLNNAIQSKRFQYSRETRNRVRSSLGINENCLVLGHVGRFNDQKNHSFLIDVFYKLHLKRQDSYLILVGDGANKNQIVSRVGELGLDNSVFFIEQTNTPEQYYQCMDLFVFPSKYEGLGIVLIEAQASGLQCIASTAVPKETNISGRVIYEDLDEDSWVKHILNFSLESREELSQQNIVRIRESGYDIETESKKLEEIYNSNI